MKCFKSHEATNVSYVRLTYWEACVVHVSGVHPTTLNEVKEVIRNNEKEALRQFNHFYGALQSQEKLLKVPLLEVAHAIFECRLAEISRRTGVF